MSKLNPKDKFTPDAVSKAIFEAGGIITGAAKKLGCDRSTVASYVKRYKVCNQAQHDGKERMIDFAESILFKNIEAGKEASVFFYLKTQAKHRGYIERSEHEVTGKGGGAVVINLVPIKAK